MIKSRADNIRSAQPGTWRWLPTIWRVREESAAELACHLNRSRLPDAVTRREVAVRLPRNLRYF